MKKKWIALLCAAALACGALPLYAEETTETPIEENAPAADETALVVKEAEATEEPELPAEEEAPEETPVPEETPLPEATETPAEPEPPIKTEEPEAEELPAEPEATEMPLPCPQNHVKYSVSFIPDLNFFEGGGTITICANISGLEDGQRLLVKAQSQNEFNLTRAVKRDEISMIPYTLNGLAEQDCVVASFTKNGYAEAVVLFELTDTTDDMGSFADELSFTYEVAY